MHRSIHWYPYLVCNRYRCDVRHWVSCTCASLAHILLWGYGYVYGFSMVLDLEFLWHVYGCIWVFSEVPPPVLDFCVPEVVLPVCIFHSGSTNSGTQKSNTGSGTSGSCLWLLLPRDGGGSTVQLVCFLWSTVRTNLPISFCAKNPWVWKIIYRVHCHNLSLLVF